MKSAPQLCDPQRDEPPEDSGLLALLAFAGYVAVFPLIIWLAA